MQDPLKQKEAEKKLEEFRLSSQPYEACKHIIDHSLDPGAQFQAITAYRDASLREWGNVLSVEMKISLLQYMVSTCLGSQERSAFVTRQLAGCASTLMKRIWGEIEIESRKSMLTEIANIAVHSEDMSGRRKAIELLHAIVVDFNPPTSSEMGLPWDYHYNCKIDLEYNFLPHILQLALQSAEMSTDIAIH